MAFNRFGAIFSGVVSLYPGTAADDYGGQATIEEAIDRAVDKITSVFPETLHNQIVSPDFLLVVQRATAGQTTFTVPMLPALAGTLRVWVGQPQLFQERPQYYPGKWDDKGLVEIDSTKYTVNVASGAGTLTYGMQFGDQVFVSYDLDVSNAAFSAPSLARLALRGAAAELGSRLFSEANQEWLLVDKYQTSFDSDIESMASGAWIPEEWRFLKWWKEVEKRTAGSASSIKLPRA